MNRTGLTQFGACGVLSDILKETLLDMCHPVGSIYMSASNTNPSALFGGTWVAWGSGRVPVGMGSNGTTNYTTVEKTGGSESASATSGGPSNNTSGGPSNNTSGKSSGSTGGPSNNTSGGPSNNTSGASSGSTGGPSNNTSGATTLTIAQMPAHSHGMHVYSNGGAAWTPDVGEYLVSSYTDKKTTWWGALAQMRSGGGQSHTHTLSNHTHSLNSHTHSLNSHTHSLQSHTHSLNDHTHSLNSHTHTLSSHTHSVSTDVRQPYITCYMWKRTA